MTFQFQKYAGMSDTYSASLGPRNYKDEMILFTKSKRTRPRLTISCRFFMIDIDLGINFHFGGVKVFSTVNQKELNA